jgi:transaldolase
MAASFRNAGEIRELAGCDNITISPSLLEELAQSREPLERRLRPDQRDSEELVIHLSESAFRYAHRKDR